MARRVRSAGVNTVHMLHGGLDEDALYQAIVRRDRRYEGRFVVAVTSTHIYCRPGACPSRTPLRKNVRFYASPAAAQAAGFRACARCRPDATVWRGTSATVERALQLIDAGALADGDVAALAERLGVGDRHLRRLFQQHLGASPLQVALTRRAHFARQLIDQTALPLAEIAFAAGYASVRRFNGAMKIAFGRTPSQLRGRARNGRPATGAKRGGRGAPSRSDAGKRGNAGERSDAGKHADERGDAGEHGDAGERGDAGENGDSAERGNGGKQGDAGRRRNAGERGNAGKHGDAGKRGKAGQRGDAGERGNAGEHGDAGDDCDAGNNGALTLKLPLRAPYAWTPLARFLAARAIPGVEIVDGERYRRTVLSDGAAGTLEVRPAGDHLLLRLNLPSARGLRDTVERARRLFDLEAEPAAIAAVLARDATLRPLVARLPGLRVPGAWDPFEVAVRAILGQQVTITHATKMCGALVAAWGTPLPSPLPGLTHVFPPAPAIAARDGDEIARVVGMPRARGKALREMARAIASGAVVLDGTVPLDELLARLCTLPGVGMWTASYLAMRLHEADAFPAGDLWLRRAFAGDDERRLLARAEAWRPYRAYAAMYLWNREP